MSCTLEDWVERIRQLSAPAAARAEAGLREEIAQLRARLDVLRGAARLGADISAAEARSAQLAAERDELLARLESARAKRIERERSLQERRLEECHTLLDRLRVAADRQLLVEAGAYLELDLMTPSPAETLDLMRNSGAVRRERARLAATLQEAARSLGSLQGRIDEVQRLESRRQELAAENRGIEERLRLEHAVSEDVLTSLTSMSLADPELAGRFRREFLEPRTAAAALERGWKLPADVLKEANGESGNGTA